VFESRHVLRPELHNTFHQLRATPRSSASSIIPPPPPQRPSPGICTGCEQEHHRRSRARITSSPGLLYLSASPYLADHTSLTRCLFEGVDSFPTLCYIGRRPPLMKVSVPPPACYHYTNVRPPGPLAIHFVSVCLGAFVRVLGSDWETLHVHHPKGGGPLSSSMFPRHPVAVYRRIPSGPPRCDLPRPGRRSGVPPGGLGRELSSPLSGPFRAGVGPAPLVRPDLCVPSFRLKRVGVEHTARSPIVTPSVVTERVSRADAGRLFVLCDWPIEVSPDLKMPSSQRCPCNIAPGRLQHGGRRPIVCHGRFARDRAPASNIPLVPSSRRPGRHMHVLF